jgi:hypothetical protein
VPAEKQDAVAFAHAATWADDIKKRGDYKFGSVSQDGQHAADNRGYVDKYAHAYWHFVDLPYSEDGTPGQPPDSPNALTQIKTFRDALSSNVDDNIRSYDLVWLLHLVGDIHQPLHTTSRFTKDFPKGDQGGNLETICRSLMCGAKLHAFWDGLLGDTGDPEDAIASATTLPLPDATQAAIADPLTWAHEGADLARIVVYTSAVGDGKGPFKLDDAYQATALQTARERAALAGARLAAMLNESVTH